MRERVPPFQTGPVQVNGSLPQGPAAPRPHQHQNLALRAQLLNVSAVRSCSSACKEHPRERPQGSGMSSAMGLPSEFSEHSFYLAKGHADFCSLSPDSCELKAKRLLCDASCYVAATCTHSWRSLRLMEAGDCVGICRHPLPEDIWGGWQKRVWEPWFLREFPSGSFGLAASGFGDPARLWHSWL